MILRAQEQNREMQRACRTKRELRDPMGLLAAVDPATSQGNIVGRYPKGICRMWFVSFLYIYHETLHIFLKQLSPAVTAHRPSQERILGWTFGGWRGWQRAGEGSAAELKCIMFAICFRTDPEPSRPWKIFCPQGMWGSVDTKGDTWSISPGRKDVNIFVYWLTIFKDFVK